MGFIYTLAHLEY